MESTDLEVTLEIGPGHLIATKYEVRELLGRGGFGEVWLARDVRNGLEVAVKLLHDTSTETHRRFETEAQALMTLDHPSCARCLDFGTTPNGHFLVMQYYRGESLKSWSRGRSLPAIVGVARDVALGLAHAHERGVLHRDLKPDNILVISAPAGDLPIILDFGLAKIVGREQGDITKTGELAGTPGFMSPEQLRGLKRAGPQTDIYSLGVILFELLENRPPYEGDSPLQLAMAHLMAPVPELSHAPPPLRELVRSMLSKEPTARPQTARAVAQRLTANRSQNADIASRTPPRAVVVAAVVGAVLLAAAGLRSTKDEPRPARQASTTAVAAALTQPEPAKPPPPTPEPFVAKETCKPRAPSGVSPIGNDGSIVYVPESLPDSPDGYAHLVIYHEGGQTPREALDELDFRKLADEHGLIIFVPEFIGGRLNQLTYQIQMDEVRGKARAAERTLCLDPERRIYLGHGSGGARAHASAYDAVAYATTSYRPMDITPEVPGRPLITMAGLKDCCEPPSGIGTCIDRKTWPLETYENHVRAANRCGETRRAWGEFPDGECFTWDCEVPFVSCHINAGRHWTDHPDDTFESTFPFAEANWKFFDEQLKRRRNASPDP